MSECEGYVTYVKRVICILYVVRKVYFKIQIKNNLPVIAKSKVNNHCSMIVNNVYVVFCQNKCRVLSSSSSNKMSDPYLLQYLNFFSSQTTNFLTGLLSNSRLDRLLKTSPNNFCWHRNPLRFQTIMNEYITHKRSV